MAEQYGSGGEGAYGAEPFDGSVGLSDLPPEPQVPITVGDLLSRTFKVFGRHFVAFFVLSLVILSPSILYEAVLYALLSTEELSVDRHGFWAHPIWFDIHQSFNDWFVATALTYLAQAVVVTIVINHMRGQAIGVGQALRAAFGRAGAVILASLLLALVTGVGFLLCIVPGIIFACMFFVTLPAIVIEGKGPIEAMNRSLELTKGYRMKIFGAAVILWLPAVALMMLAGGIMVAVATTDVTQQEMLRAEILAVALNWVVLIVMSILTAVLSAVLYVRVRDVREGMDLDQLASVFR